MLLIACQTDVPRAAPDEVVEHETPGDQVDQRSRDPLVVVATVAPIADLVARVGGDRVDVRSLVPQGADAHTWSPRPRDAIRLSEADVFFGVGLDLNTSALNLAERNLPPGAALVLLGEQALADTDIVFDHTHDHDVGHTHDDGAGHTHDDGVGHTHDDDRDAQGTVDTEEPTFGPNPHVWTSVRNAARMVDFIAATLTERDPDGASLFRRNADELQYELTRLDDAIAAGVTTIPEHHRVLVTYHDAWTYFARDYGLDYAVAVQMSDYSEPSAGEVRRLIDLIRTLEVVAVFGSEVFPTPVLEVIAEETGAAYHDGLSDDVLPGRPGDPDNTYLALMRRNAVIIIEGLGGDASGVRALTQ